MFLLSTLDSVSKGIVILRMFSVLHGIQHMCNYDIFYVSPVPLKK